jgi:hypothetical protein
MKDYIYLPRDYFFKRYGPAKGTSWLVQIHGCANTYEVVVGVKRQGEEIVDRTVKIDLPIHATITPVKNCLGTTVPFTAYVSYPDTPANAECVYQADPKRCFRMLVEQLNNTQRKYSKLPYAIR